MAADGVRPGRVHGSVPMALRARFERGGRPLLDLSGNVSPYGWAPQVERALREAPLHCYPDPACQLAREAVAERFGVRPGQVAIGNGAAELIWSVARALLQPGAVVLEVRPTFGEFSAAASACGATVRALWADHAAGFRYDLPTLSERLREHTPRLCYLCTPNNPSGAPLAFIDVLELAWRHSSTTFLVDQAYLGLSPGFADLELRPASNVICLRSLTKEQGLPGVRVGYLIAEEAIVDAIERHRPSWSVNAYAQAIVPPALMAGEFVAEVRERLQQDRQRADKLLTAVGLRTVASDGPFVLARCGDAQVVCKQLLHTHGIAVRDCTSFGLPDHVRVAGVAAGDAPRLAHALQSLSASAFLDPAERT